MKTTIKGQNNPTIKILIETKNPKETKELKRLLYQIRLNDDSSTVQKNLLKIRKCLSQLLN